MLDITLYICICIYIICRWAYHIFHQILQPIASTQHMIIFHQDTISICLYFFRVIDTASLYRSGSIRMFERMRGIYPKKSTNVLMHFCLCIKCSAPIHIELFSAPSVRLSLKVFRWVTLIGGCFVT